uniref:Uncharacterized protein n=1 Tax=Junco hyemalis TaxID=40217 RepID=A0A8C5IAR1_JUNHY
MLSFNTSGYFLFPTHHVRDVSSPDTLHIQGCGSPNHSMCCFHSQLLFQTPPNPTTVPSSDFHRSSPLGSICKGKFQSCLTFKRG